MTNEKAWYMPPEPYPLPCFNLITLISYLFSLLPFACIACLCASLCLCTLALTPYPTRCVGLSTYVIKSFSSFCAFFSPSFLVFLFKVFYFSPSWVLSLTFHFSLPFSPSWLPSASLLLCMFALIVASVVSVDVRVSWTDGVCERSAALLTHGQHHTRTQAIKHVCGGFPPRQGP